MKDIRTVWFVEPLDATTNAVISAELTDTEVHPATKCKDGTHDLWDCSYRLIAQLAASRQQLGLKFQVFRRRGGGQIEKWRFASRSRLDSRPRSKRIR